MSKYKKHLYAIMYPNFALIASQLEPKEFGRYYSVGSTRFYSGKMLFIEVDPEYRNPFFPIDEYLAQTVEHPDGSPKMTKFISSYRVLEHIDNSALGTLYLVTTSGDVLPIERKPYVSTSPHPKVRIIQELNPIQLLVASTYGKVDLGKYLTTPGNPRGCPRLFFSEIILDAEKFVSDWKSNPFINAPFPGLHPQKLAQTLEELMSDPTPRTKSIGIQSIFDKLIYARCKGFYVACGEDLIHYPMPSQELLQKEHFTWWKHSDG